MNSQQTPFDSRHAHVQVFTSRAPHTTTDQAGGERRGAGGAHNIFPISISYLFSVVALQLPIPHQKINVVLVEHGDMAAARSMDVSFCFTGTPGSSYRRRCRHRPPPNLARLARALRADDAVTGTDLGRVAVLVSIATDALSVVRVRRGVRRGVLRVRGARRRFLWERGRRRDTPRYSARLLPPPLRQQLMLLLP